MNQERRPRNPEEWGEDTLGNILTGGKIQLYRNLGQLLVKIMATDVLVLIRHRFGVNAVSFGTTSWGALFLFILMTGSAIGNTEYIPGKGVVAATHGSQGLFSAHLMLFIFFSLYHILESRRNLRRKDGKGRRRHGFDLGESHLAFLLGRLLRHTGLLQDGPAGAWYQINYFTVQKWIEPLFVIGVGIGFQAFGYHGYGWFLILCGLSVHALAVTQERVYYEHLQRLWDGAESTEMMTSQLGKNQPTLRGNTTVTPPSAHGSSGIFETWKQQRDQHLHEE